ncbi:centromere protein W-like [Mastomys coucha]|uniref:centromere protein W-like n=1 Tax=Mastomys coucha TaxID=35658 RepID=UPI001261B31E|nr:centromere protein W-like [Mastomys coucha]
MTINHTGPCKITSTKIIQKVPAREYLNYQHLTPNMGLELKKDLDTQGLAVKYNWKLRLCLERCCDLLIHLNCLFFVHRLAEESKTNACESKCGVIKKDHVWAAAKVILKKSRD